MDIKAFATQTSQHGDARGGILSRAVSRLCGASRLMFASFRARVRGAPHAASAASLVALGVALAGCAQQPTGAKRSSEYFPSSVYGAASPRVVGEGQAVPRGGGQRLVGRPYTVAGKQYVPRPMRPGTALTGNASWYGSAFHGRRTANGEVYDMRALSAAHPTMPLPSYARVTNLRNGHSVIVRVNDRGPFHAGRVLDVSQKVAEVLAFRNAGTGQVKVDYIGPAALAGSDDALLLASLRTDGRPATMPAAPPAGAPVTMVADAARTAPAAPATAQPQSSGVVTVSQSPPASQGQGQGQSLAPQVALTQTTTALAPRSAPAASSATASPLTAPPLALSGSVPSFAPMPPRRPIDLATIPGADTPIMPPVPMPRPRSGASFFAEPSGVTSFFVERGPFDSVDKSGVQPLR